MIFSLNIRQADFAFACKKLNNIAVSVFRYTLAISAAAGARNSDMLDEVIKSGYRLKSDLLP